LLAALAQLSGNIAFSLVAHLLGNVVLSLVTPATPSTPAPLGFSPAAPAQLASNIAFSSGSSPRQRHLLAGDSVLARLAVVAVAAASL
jgi:hypothetical protein